MSTSSKSDASSYKTTAEPVNRHHPLLLLSYIRSMPRCWRRYSWQARWLRPFRAPTRHAANLVQSRSRRSRGRANPARGRALEYSPWPMGPVNLYVSGRRDSNSRPSPWRGGQPQRCTVSVKPEPILVQLPSRIKQATKAARCRPFQGRAHCWQFAVGRTGGYARNGSAAVVAG